MLRMVPGGADSGQFGRDADSRAVIGIAPDETL